MLVNRVSIKRTLSATLLGSSGGRFSVDRFRGAQVKVIGIEIECQRGISKAPPNTRDISHQCSALTWARVYPFASVSTFKDLA